MRGLIDGLVNLIKLSKAVTYFMWALLYLMILLFSALFSFIDFVLLPLKYLIFQLFIRMHGRLNESKGVKITIEPKMAKRTQMSWVQDVVFFKGLEKEILLENS